MERYDLLVIGAGPGGYEAAVKAAQLGDRVALIERRELGGTCLNRGCIPTKTLLHTAHLYHTLQNGADLGIRAEHLHLDTDALYARRDAVVQELRNGIAALMKRNRIDVYQGTAAVTAPDTVRISGGKEETILCARHILIATGSVPARPPIPGADLPGILTSDDLLEGRPELPRHLLIIGGGVIGMEFAALYRSLGCRVTVLEAAARILPMLDRELSRSLKLLCKKQDIAIHTGVRVTCLAQTDGAYTCTYETAAGTAAMEADGILLAAGRQANTEALLDGPVSLEMERGCIAADRAGRTSIPGIYAIGDVTGGTQLAHAATAQGINAVCHMHGMAPLYNLDTVPVCVYTSPEIASVGLTPDEAKAKGYAAVTGKYTMSANGKSVLSGQERGFIKVCADSGTGVILGAQMMCASATDLIGEFASALTNGLTLRQMAEVIRPHPTYSEGITGALDAALQKVNNPHNAKRYSP